MQDAFWSRCFSLKAVTIKDPWESHSQWHLRWRNGFCHLFHVLLSAHTAQACMALVGMGLQIWMKKLALRFGMPPFSLHSHYAKPFKCEDFWLDPRFLVLEVVLFHLLPSRPSSKHVGCGRCVPFLGLILARIKLFTRMGVWGSSLQETKKLFVGYKLLKKQNKVGLYLIFLQTKIRTVHNQQSHQIAPDKTFVKVWGKVDTVASKHAKQPHPRHPLKSKKHHPCPSPHSQPASVCSRINMRNQQCPIHLSYEHWEVKNQDEQADRVDVGMGGFWCIVFLIYLYIYLGFQHFLFSIILAICAYPAWLMAPQDLFKK